MRPEVLGRKSALVLAMFLCAPPLLAPAASRAQVPAPPPVSAEQAATLQTGLRGWIAGLFPLLLAPAAVPLDITADGGHYRAALDLAAFPDVAAGPDTALTAFLSPLADGRWQVDDIRMPSPFAIEAEGPEGPFATRLAVAGQKAGAVVDPSGRTPSRYSGTFGAIVGTSDGPAGTATTRMDRAAFDTTFTPAGPGVFDYAASATMEGYRSRQTLPRGLTVAYAVKKIVSTGRLSGLDTADLRGLLADAAALLAPAQPLTPASTGVSPGAAAARRAAAHRLLGDLAGLFVSADARQTWSGVTFRSGTVSGAIGAVSLGTAMAAPAGKAELRLRLALSGLVPDDATAAELGPFVPTGIVIAPSLRGVAKPALVAFLSRGIDEAANPRADLSAEAWGFLARHPVDVGLDEVRADFPGFAVAGHGRVSIASPTDIAGHALVRVTGMDALMRAVRHSPQAGRLLPALILLRGLGKTEGKATVWRIAYAGHKIAINGTDLSSLTGPRPPAR